MPRVKTRSAFGDTLRQQLEATGVSIRKLSRLLASSPEHAEPKRRLLQKYVAGEVTPSEQARIEIAAALGVDAAVFAEDSEAAAAERRLYEAMAPLAAELTRLAIEAGRKASR